MKIWNITVDLYPATATIYPSKSIILTWNVAWDTTGSLPQNNEGVVDDAESMTIEVTSSLPDGVTPSYSPATFPFSNDGSQNGSITLTAASTALPTIGSTPVVLSLTINTSTSPVSMNSITVALTVQQGFYTGNGSVTYWNLFVPQAMDQSSPQELATAPIRDPLWMLARQWQLKEFEGSDAGSAIQVRYLAEQAGLNRYIGGSGQVNVFNEQTRAIESAVESEVVNLQMRGAVQLGLRLEAMLCDAGANALIAQFRKAFPITIPSASALYDIRTAAYASLAAGSVINGWALYQLASTQPTSTTIPAGATQVVQAFVAWCTSLYVRPGTDPAWNAERITYNFGAASSQPATTIVVKAPDFSGGRLDWYDFDFAGSSSSTTGALNSTATTVRSTGAAPDAASSAKTTTQFPRTPVGITPSPAVLARLGGMQAPPPTYVAGTTLPNHIRFPGMPEARYWNFEDGRLNLGAIQPNMTDLASMLVLEFAFVYSNDWFIVTLPTPIGSLTKIVGLVVTDTFGIRTLIEPADGTTTGPAGNTLWTMFTMSGGTGQMDSVLLAPTLADVQDGPAIEEVWFARDDMAAMAWGEEKTLQGPLDNGVNVYEDVVQRVVPTTQPATKSTTAQVAYVLGTSVPANWIPMVPIPGDSLFRLRRGAMSPLSVDPTTGRLVRTAIYPRGVVLRQDQLSSGKPPMMLVRDSAIAPSGVQVTRYFRRARWIDGSTSCWIARDVMSGTGQANSGLAFDVLQPVTPNVS
jgi:hypothetical protein